MLRPAYPDHPWHQGKNLRVIIETLRSKFGKPFAELKYAEWYNLAFNEASALAGCLHVAYPKGMPPELQKHYTTLKREVQKYTEASCQAAAQKASQLAQTLVSQLENVDTLTPEELVRFIKGPADLDIRRAFNQERDAILRPLKKESTETFLLNLVEYILDHQKEVGAALDELLDQLQERHRVMAPKLTKGLAAKIIRAVKRTGTYSPRKVLTELATKITEEECVRVNLFLDWVNKQKLTFGPDTIHELYQKMQDRT